MSRSTKMLKSWRVRGVKTGSKVAKVNSIYLVGLYSCSPATVKQSVGSQRTNLEWLVQYLLVRRLREVRRSAGWGGGLSGPTRLTCRWTNTQRLHSAVMTSSEMDFTLRVGLSFTIPAGIHQSWRLAAFFLCLFLYRAAQPLKRFRCERKEGKKLSVFFFFSSNFSPANQERRNSRTKTDLTCSFRLSLLNLLIRTEVMRNKTASAEDSWQRWTCSAAMGLVSNPSVLAEHWTIHVDKSVVPLYLPKSHVKRAA